MGENKCVYLEIVLILSGKYVNSRWFDHFKNKLIVKNE